MEKFYCGHSNPVTSFSCFARGFQNIELLSLNITLDRIAAFDDFTLANAKANGAANGIAALDLHSGVDGG
jgi:hypothetical protein